VANRDFTPVEKLGKEIFEDLNLSAQKNQACNSCHNSSAEFADPDNTLAPDARPVSQRSDRHICCFQSKASLEYQ
jgi:cytochrome c peroxidase